MPESDDLSKDAGDQRFLLRLEGLGLSDGPHLVRRQARRRHFEGGRAGDRAGWTLDLMAKHSLDFWLTSEDLPDPNNRVTVDRDGKIGVSYKPNNVEGHDRLKAQAAKSDEANELRRSRPRMSSRVVCAKSLPRPTNSARGGGPPERHHRFGDDPKTSALDRELQSPRTGQSLRRGRELLPIERRRESGADDHG